MDFARVALLWLEALGAQRRAERGVGLWKEAAHQWKALAEATADVPRDYEIYCKLFVDATVKSVAQGER
jgi:hypothetical protein